MHEMHPDVKLIMEAAYIANVDQLAEAIHRIKSQANNCTYIVVVISMIHFFSANFGSGTLRLYF
jgi:hypothetical protein